MRGLVAGMPMGPTYLSCTGVGMARGGTRPPQLSLSRGTPTDSLSSGRLPRNVASGYRNEQAGSTSRRHLLTSLLAASAATPMLKTSVASALTPSTVSLAAASESSEFWSGLIAGAVQKTAKELVLHPLDTVKTRVQTSRRALTLDLFLDRPFAGLGPAITSGAPAASVFFAVKDAVKQRANALQLDTSAATLLAVACANVPYWLVRNPTEVIKARRQAGIVDDSLEAARKLYAEEGLRGFYTGYVSNYAYAYPVDSIKFVLYELLKKRVRAAKGGAKLSAVESAVGGAVSAVSAQSLATPLDVARTRAMTRPAGAPPMSPIECVRAIAAEEGLPALFSGVTPKAVRAVLSGAIQFSTYEATKDFVNQLLKVR
uniref:Mitochondrial carrier protein n=1 Tax=Chrysotila carterae TaxID=13221 RepID=A0A7S4C3C4_CHRCT